VVSEVAVASVLLCGTALMLRSLFNLQRANPGFNPANASVFFMNVSGGMDSSPGARAAFYARLLNRLRGLPDVTAAAACSALPLSGRYCTQVYAVEGRPPPEAGANPVANLRVVSPGYFHAMEIPLLAGREFTEADNATSPKVLILDATFARQQFGTENPIGKRIRWNHNDPTSSREIVGIAGDVKHGTIDGQIRPGFYMPYAQNPRPTMGIVVRTASEQPSGLLATIRQTVRELDPSLAIYEAQTLQQMIAETFWVRRYLGRLLIGFAALALGLAAVGVASVVASR
jgi:putative ABC transport system permease protein